MQLLRNLQGPACSGAPWSQGPSFARATANDIRFARWAGTQQLLGLSASPIQSFILQLLGTCLWYNGSRSLLPRLWVKKGRQTRPDSTTDEPTPPIGSVVHLNLILSIRYQSPCLTPEAHQRAYQLNRTMGKSTVLGRRSRCLPPLLLAVLFGSILVSSSILLVAAENVTVAISAAGPANPDDKPTAVNLNDGPLPEKTNVTSRKAGPADGKQQVTKLASGCADANSNCAGWAQSGYCGPTWSFNGQSVRDVVCRASCNTCSQPGACIGPIAGAAVQRMSRWTGSARVFLFVPMGAWHGRGR